MKYIISILIFLTYSNSVFGMAISKHSNDHKGLNAIYLSGIIERGDTFRLKVYISKLKKKKNIAVYLNSIGGNLYEGIKLGELFRDAQIKTVIESKQVCASACAIAFLGGYSRGGKHPWQTKSSDAGLGFHTFYNLFGDEEQLTGEEANEWIRTSQLTILKLIRYYNKMGIDIKLLEDTLSANQDEMYWLSNSDALDYGFNIWDVKDNKMIDGFKFLSIKN